MEQQLKKKIFDMFNQRKYKITKESMGDRGIYIVHGIESNDSVTNDSDKKFIMISMISASESNNKKMTTSENKLVNEHLAYYSKSDVGRIIILTPKEFTSTNLIDEKYYEYLLHINIMINPLNSSIDYEISVVSDSAFETIKQSHSIKNKKSLMKILTGDAMIKYLGIKPGTIIQIKRPNWGIGNTEYVYQYKMVTR